MSVSSNATILIILESSQTGTLYSKPDAVLILDDLDYIPPMQQIQNNYTAA